jgi:glutamyl-tRNA synthetase
MAELARWWLRDRLEYDEKAVAKHLKPAAVPVLEDLLARMRVLEPWSQANLEQLFQESSAALGNPSMGKLAQPVRVAVTGQSNSPGIFETLQVLGRERSVERVAKAVAIARERRPES